MGTFQDGASEDADSFSAKNILSNQLAWCRGVYGIWGKRKAFQTRPQEKARRGNRPVMWNYCHGKSTGEGDTTQEAGDFRSAQERSWESLRGSEHQWGGQFSLTYPRQT